MKPRWLRISEPTFVFCKSSVQSLTSLLIVRTYIGSDKELKVSSIDLTPLIDKKLI